ncbi:MAG TPA: hypothetical protein VFG49_12570 [Dyella sp.]|uniref:hypothetical protein n=1 Tax=Dyella sp. TaxID=1869338 RepID=UPI002D77FA6F|nr:hypothetical protein [Dyella sp.]HET6554361.1 hypothetical protein [Dyella sp.]
MTEPAGLGTFASVVREISTKSAINPMLWLFGLCSMVLIAVSLGHPEPVVLYSILALWIFFGLTGGGGFLYFMFKNPDRLQDERHIERMAAIQAQAKEGSPKTLPSDVATSNPNVIDAVVVDVKEARLTQAAAPTGNAGGKA